MTTITATHVAYYHLCVRKLWLFHNGITMEQDSELVAEGRFLHETAYPQRAERYTEVQLSCPLGEGGVEASIKIDFFDAKSNTVHEVKKSKKMDGAHKAQLKFYLYVLELNGVVQPKGILEYPKLRHTEGVVLGDEDRGLIGVWVADIVRILSQEACPVAVRKGICAACAYHDFCYVD